MPTPQTNARTQEAIALTFALTGPADGVARVTRLAQHRLAQRTGWSGWRISGFELGDEVDWLHISTVQIQPVGHFAEEATLMFALSANSDRPSVRFNALLRAAGIVDKIEDDRELIGRHFAMRGWGASPSDFANFGRLFA